VTEPGTTEGCPSTANAKEGIVKKLNFINSSDNKKSKLEDWPRF
jgi:hypothetical protein